jgi:hypothetical protein
MSTTYSMNSEDRMSLYYPHKTKFNLTYAAKSDLIITSQEGFSSKEKEGVS